MSNLRISDCQDTALWDGFVKASPQGNVFCTSRFLSALGHSVRLLLVEEDGSIKAAVPILHRDGIPLRAPQLLCLYHGPMFSAEMEALPSHSRVLHQLRLLDFLLADLSAQLPLISFCLHPAFRDLRSFLWFNYHAPDAGTFCVDLCYTGILPLDRERPFDEYLAGVRDLRRREYRRAEKEGFVVEPSEDIDQLDRLHEITFRRQGIERSVELTTLVREISKAALRDGFGRCWVARSASGQVVSACLFLFDDRTAYYLIGANDPEFRKSGAATFLMLRMIESFHSEGKQSVDFVGVNSPNRGDFKVSFNAEPVAYHVVHWARP